MYVSSPVWTYSDIISCSLCDTWPKTRQVKWLIWRNEQVTRPKIQTCLNIVERQREGERSPLYNNSFLRYFVYERPKEICTKFIWSKINKDSGGQQCVARPAQGKIEKKNQKQKQREIKNKRKYETILCSIWGKLLQLKAAGNWQTMRDP